jgi:hypothetical protein
VLPRGAGLGSGTAATPLQRRPGPRRSPSPVGKENRSSRSARGRGNRAGIPRRHAGPPGAGRAGGGEATPQRIGLREAEINRRYRRGVRDRRGAREEAGGGPQHG